MSIHIRWEVIEWNSKSLLIYDHRDLQNGRNWISATIEFQHSGQLDHDDGNFSEDIFVTIISKYTFHILHRYTVLSFLISFLFSIHKIILQINRSCTDHLCPDIIKISSWSLKFYQWRSYAFCQISCQIYNISLSVLISIWRNYPYHEILPIEHFIENRQLKEETLSRKTCHLIRTRKLNIWRTSMIYRIRYTKCVFLYIQKVRCVKTKKIITDTSILTCDIDRGILFHIRDWYL